MKFIDLVRIDHQNELQVVKSWRPDLTCMLGIENGMSYPLIVGKAIAYYFSILAVNSLVNPESFKNL
jgi:hypothetical protein